MRGPHGGRSAKRIALITTSFPAYAGDASGHFVAAEAQELALAGHHVCLVRPGGEGCAGDHAFGWPGAAARIRERPLRSLDALRFVANARARLRALEARGLDEVHAHWMVPCAWPIATAVDVPLRVMCHGGDVRLLCAMPRALRAHIVERVTTNAWQVAFAGRNLRQQLLTSLDDRVAGRLEAISTVQSPLLVVAVPSPRERRATRQRLRGGCDGALILTVGRLVAGKRIDLAIRAVAACHTPVRLVIVGDGPERTALEQLARELDVDARFEGRRDRDATHAIMAACDVLLHTSEAEGAPSVVREARVLGLRVVATDSGDLNIWATNDPRLQVVEADPAHLARALANTPVRSPKTEN